LRQEVWKKPDELVEVVMEAVKLSDVVKFSEEELMLLTATESIEAGLKQLESFNLPLVVITQGEEGSLVIANNQQFRVSANPVNVVDTTGAGDAFVSGLLAKLSQHTHWNEHSVIVNAVKWGNACGGLATTQKGAMTALPNKLELEALL
ncbi:PfkB family carbohydrate kinase, partial [Vibrio makurazakiensis]|uniref:PfkB family carbohydrate kinase n=1 Tax=Vibrio makurazakiensis TaxID=2910250 RepID=UPI003D1475B1